MSEHEIDVQEHFLKYADLEKDPEIINDGESALHTALQILHQHVDKAFSFILYRFNRIGIKHESLDAVLTMDKDCIPTLCINYSKFKDMTLLCQIGLLEHMVGHLMSGHMGSKLGKEMLAYCERMYGLEHGRKMYHLVTESVADSYVTYPGALKDNGRPHYDVRRLGLDRWSYTLTVLNRMESLLDEGGNDGGDGENKNDPNGLGAALQALINNMGQDEDDDEIGSPGGEVGNATGNLPVKDLVSLRSDKDSIMAEDMVRDICKEAIDRNPTSKSRGFLEGDAGQFVKASDTPPVVPWHQRVNHIITSGISTERRITKKRINRRNPDFGFGRVYINMTRLLFVIDTSGSMGEDSLCHVDAELSCIAQVTEQDIQIIHCDAGVAKCETYRRGMRLEEFFGRGGTTFDPALEYIRDEVIEKPDIIVYFTDGYGGSLDDDNPIIPEHESRILWLLTPDGMDEKTFRDRITKLGDVIKIEKWNE
jgi:hypothetical protein